MSYLRRVEQIKNHLAFGLMINHTSAEATPQFVEDREILDQSTNATNVREQCNFITSHIRFRRLNRNLNGSGKSLRNFQKLKL